jgi:hypothetical protein
MANPGYIRPHYHIHWGNKQTLDWQCFQSYAEASKCASELAGPHEAFTIEEVSLDCPLLKAAPSRAERAGTG